MEEATRGFLNLVPLTLLRNQTTARANVMQKMGRQGPLAFAVTSSIEEREIVEAICLDSENSSPSKPTTSAEKDEPRTHLVNQSPR